jgi:hypothetical protein
MQDKLVLSTDRLHTTLIELGMAIGRTLRAKGEKQAANHDSSLERSI